MDRYCANILMLYVNRFKNIPVKPINKVALITPLFSLRIHDRIFVYIIRPQLQFEKLFFHRFVLLLYFFVKSRMLLQVVLDVLTLEKLIFGLHFRRFSFFLLFLSTWLKSILIWWQITINSFDRRLWKFAFFWNLTGSSLCSRFKICQLDYGFIFWMKFTST